MKRATVVRLMALASLLGPACVGAQERDPTQPPASVAQAPAGGVAKAEAEAIAIDASAIVLRNGKPFLVSGTRLYTVGQSIGPYKIERISETEVWLRQGKELRKIPRFNGIERHTATERPTP